MKNLGKKNKVNPIDLKPIKFIVDSLNKRWPSTNKEDNQFIALFPRYGEKKWIIGCKSLPLSYSNKVIGTCLILSKQMKLPIEFHCYYEAKIHSKFHSKEGLLIK